MNASSTLLVYLVVLPSQSKSKSKSKYMYQY